MKDHLINSLGDFFKVLSNKTRIEILYLLSEKPLTVTEIKDSLNLDQSLISHQLKILRESDLVRTKRKGKNIYYCIADSHIYEIFNQAIEHIEEDNQNE